MSHYGLTRAVLEEARDRVRYRYPQDGQRLPLEPVLLSLLLGESLALLDILAHPPVEQKSIDAALRLLREYEWEED